MGPDLRRTGDRLGWRSRGCSLKSKRDLCRNRRGIAATGSLNWRRRLQVQRRRQDLATHGTPRRTADRRHHRRPSRREQNIRCGPRTSLRTESGTRSLPLDQRGRDIRARSLQGREYRRDSGRIRSDQSADDLRRALGGKAGPVGEFVLERASQRPVQVRRWRHYLAADRNRIPDGRARSWSNRFHHRAE